ncbi:tyrosine protein phosphatase [Jiella sp. MQZ9-1]|uniref:Tyrosine protein phosphatase n=1 Tax=Jiella flava TaxID=2816857 RepID=A0A939G266_9HYPH|nr:tyrosine protein phosphatase [Jiella flava]MBO0663704.1 tyrosine protein phosphatase [Jiella flava]MCD2472277.1 tyrosine protein phosphatase [Jiella flava]
MSYLVVSSLADMPKTVAEHGARDLLTLINAETPVARPETVEASRHLFLAFNDIAEPMDGFTAPGALHVDQLIDFGHRWDRQAPLAIHCWAGISRSTAAAYVLALAVNPALDEARLAKELRRRAPSASPNPRIVAMADAKLQRGGRMVAAIRAIGRGEDAFSGTPFTLPLTL